MKTLQADWFYSGISDAEYKKYVLLAYLQDVHRLFNQNKLYPHLADLVMHYRNLVLFYHQFEQLNHQFPVAISTVDLSDFKIAFTKVIEDDETMKNIAETVEFAIPQIKSHLEEGQEIYEFVESLIRLEPVGILPLYTREGYIFVKDSQHQDLLVYEYEVKLISTTSSTYNAVSTTFISRYEQNFVNTTANIKIDLIRKRKKLPNPATFISESELQFPLEETMMQVTKRLLLGFLASQT